LVDRHVLAVDLELGRAAQHDVCLLDLVLRVVVLRVLIEPSRQVEHLHAERLDPQLGRRELDGAMVERPHLLDLLQLEVGHPLAPNPVAQRSRRGR
jgi:hypothetical protein